LTLAENVNVVLPTAREKEKERERERERKRKRKRERERERGRERREYLLLKGMTGALAPFSYLVKNKNLVTTMNIKRGVLISKP
jgi:hypothetical protein